MKKEKKLLKIDRTNKNKPSQVFFITEISDKHQDE